MFNITKHGSLLDESEYTIDRENKTFITEETGLVINFPLVSGWFFKTGVNCTFYTSGECIFKTNRFCSFTTGENCTFRTGENCTFNTGDSCTFLTGSRCTFKTGSYCTFTTGYGCTFRTADSCTFMLWDINRSKFKTYDDVSTILDLNDKKRYVLTKDLMDVLKLSNG